MFECDLFVYERKMNVLLSYHEKNVGANFVFLENILKLDHITLLYFSMMHFYIIYRKIELIALFLFVCVNVKMPKL